MKKNLTQASDIGNGEAVPVWGRGIWDVFVPSFQFCSELKPASKKSSLYKKVLEPSYVNRKLEVR